MYIRIENEILKVEKEIQRNNKKFYQVEGYNCIVIPESMITSKADTIEEIFDELVMKDKEGNIEILTYNKSWNYEAIIENLKEANQINNTIYGAIWTSKGLIYVAKMNSEGKLVLI